MQLGILDVPLATSALKANYSLTIIQSEFHLDITAGYLHVIKSCNIVLFEFKCPVQNCLMAFVNKTGKYLYRYSDGAQVLETNIVFNQKILYCLRVAQHINSAAQTTVNTELYMWFSKQIINPVN